MLSIIFLTKNEEHWIEGAIKTALFADEIIVIDSGSTDNTIRLVKKYTPKVYPSKSRSFADWRNLGLKKASGDWIFYLDADERITKPLQQELTAIINDRSREVDSYAVPRKNFYFGYLFRSSNSFPDYQHRFFKREKLAEWKGLLHERPVMRDPKDSVGYLSNPIWHFTHRDIESMVNKTNRWSLIEAKELLASKHPEMVWWRFFSIIFRSFFKQFFVFRGGKDGDKGVVEGLFQIFSNFISYAKLWELQQKESAQERYQRLEKELAEGKIY